MPLLKFLGCIRAEYDGVHNKILSRVKLPNLGETYQYVYLGTCGDQCFSVHASMTSSTSSGCSCKAARGEIKLLIIVTSHSIITMRGRDIPNIHVTIFIIILPWRPIRLLQVKGGRELNPPNDPVRERIYSNT